jgi:hypothetical protein
MYGVCWQYDSRPFVVLAFWHSENCVSAKIHSTIFFYMARFPGGRILFFKFKNLANGTLGFPAKFRLECFLSFQMIAFKGLGFFSIAKIGFFFSS